MRPCCTSAPDSTFRSAKEEVAAWEPRVQDVLAEKNLSGVFSICKDYKAMEEKEASSASSR